MRANQTHPLIPAGGGSGKCHEEAAGDQCSEWPRCQSLARCNLSSAIKLGTSTSKVQFLRKLCFLPRRSASRYKTLSIFSKWPVSPTQCSKQQAFYDNTALAEGADCADEPGLCGASGAGPSDTFEMRRGWCRKIYNSCGFRFETVSNWVLQVFERSRMVLVPSIGLEQRATERKAECIYKKKVLQA